MSKPNTNPEALDQVQPTPEEAIPQVELNENDLDSVAGGAPTVIKDIQIPTIDTIGTGCFGCDGGDTTSYL